jgi:tetratricopeptide (TPR) repeat protein
VLASVVLKLKEQLLALHQNITKIIYRQHSIPRAPGTNWPSKLSLRAEFLTGIALQTEIALTHSQQKKWIGSNRCQNHVAVITLWLAVLFVISPIHASTDNLSPSYSVPVPQRGPLGTAGPPATQQPSVPELFASGEAALRSGNLNEAERAFTQVLVQDPNSAGAYANLGVIAMRRQNWSEALDLLQEAERLAPRVAGIRLNIGLVYYRQSDFHSAIAPFESVVREQPGSVQARYLLGLCYFFTDRYAEAVRVLRDLWPQESDDLNYLYVLGNAADKAGNTVLQERALTRFIELGQNTAEYHLLMGKAFLNREENDKAVAELEQAAQSDPNLPFVHFNLGLAYLVRLDFAHAKEEFQEDIALEPDVAFNYDRLGLIYVYLQDDEEAEQNFREALRRDPHLASSYFGLARVYQREKKLDEALVAIDSARKIDPDNPNYHNLKGQILLRVGRAKEGQVELDAATRLLNVNRARRQKELSGEALPQPELTAEPKP